ncbi:AMP-binding protein [Clavibacter zhangzhiyongii]|uniref:AMP-binding protein n=1 Tax=Clavibacter zhangzhiyongii TaxID=2768071 RepID=UPI0039E16F6D
MPPAHSSYRAARDLLQEMRTERTSAVDRFRWPDVGESFNWAVDWFDGMARGNDRVALRVVAGDGSERSVTFDEMATRSDRVATWLVGLGVRKGDHVMLMLGNRVELWEAMLAIMKAGAVILPTSTVLGAADLADRVERAGVRAVIADVAHADVLDEVPGGFLRVAIGATDGAPAAAGWTDYREADRAPADRVDVRVASTDPALVYFTSGTTSKPKMVVHTHVSYPVGHLTTMYWLGLRPGDVHLAISSPGWGKHAWSCFFAPWIAEATVFVHDYARFDAHALVEQLDRAEVTTFCAPPTVWRMLIQAGIRQRPGRLQEIMSAGEPLNPEVIARIEEWWGLVIRDGYGQTETTAIVANAPGDPVVPGSMGTALPGVDLVLVDPVTGERADEGEICLDLATRPVNLMAGYLGDEERTAEAMRGGLFHTGDVARRDAEGTITFIGRTDDIFKSSDYKVSPFEVESVLIEHPAVAEAAVVGAPDDVRLNVAKAYVHLAAGWEPDEETALAVLRHARERCPAFMRVRRVEFGELPKTASGKIRRVELRQREVEAADAGERLAGEWRDDQFPGLRAR